MWQDSNTFTSSERELASALARELNDLSTKLTSKYNGPFRGTGGDVSTTNSSISDNALLSKLALSAKPRDIFRELTIVPYLS